MSTSDRLILGLAPGTNPDSPPSTVVITELFTSEGRSSCPRADTFVRQLAGAQRFDGPHSIALGDLSDRDRMLRRDGGRGIAQNWNSRNLQLVRVIQERDSRRIPGADATEPSFRPGSDQ